VRQLLVRAGLAALCALSLSGCIDSSGPILADSQAVFGPRLKLQLFSLREGFAHDPDQATFSWNGALYAHSAGGMKDVSAFSVHPFEAGDTIIQTVPARQGQTTEFALLHKLAEGVFQVVAVDEADADEQTRAAYCRHVDHSGCRIETREQLFAFARATAAQRKGDGGLAIRLPDGPEKAKRPARRSPPKKQ
jgi:hypothetical protein